MTYYDPSVGLTSCDTLHGPNELIVALSPGIMNNGGNPNSHPECLEPADEAGALCLRRRYLLWMSG